MWTKKDKEEKSPKTNKPKEKTVEEVEKQLEESKAKLEELKEESSEESEETKEVEDKEEPKVSKEPVWQVREVPTQKEAVIYNSKENKMYDLLSAVVEILNRTE